MSLRSLCLAGFGWLITLSAHALVPPWDRDGHEHTTAAVTKSLGVDADIARRVTYFSQAPDDRWFLYSAPSVAIWGVLWLPYRHRIMNVLHSLHGGDDKVVRDRRAALARLITTYDFRVRADHWKIGFLIHALGDSFAHVYGPEDDLHSYNEIWGHAFDNGTHGTKPDVITEHEQRYVGFVNTLCGAIAGSKGVSAQCAPDLGAILFERVRKNGNPDVEPVQLPDQEQAAAEITLYEVDAFLATVERALQKSRRDEPNGAPSNF